MVAEEDLLYRYYEYLCQSEQLVTGLIKEIIKELTLHNIDIYLEGLDKRIKSKQSFISKCNRNDRLYPKVFYVYDVLRYTIILPIECFCDYYQVTINHFKKKDFEVYRVKNTWIQFDKDIPYRGINVLVGYKNGLVLEIQFHTYESYQVNITTHKLYEKLLKCLSDEKISKIKGKMKKFVDNLQTPNGISNILEYKNEDKMLSDILKFIERFN